MISGGGGGGENATGTVRLDEVGRGGTGGALRREEARSEAARAALKEAIDPLALREREGVEEAVEVDVEEKDSD